MEMIELDNKLTILCVNDNKEYTIDKYASLKDIATSINPLLQEKGNDKKYGTLAALVDHQLKGLDYSVSNPHKIEFIGYKHPEGRRTYIRSLCFVLQKAVKTLFPDKCLIIDHTLPSGLYCEIREVHSTNSSTNEQYKWQTNKIYQITKEEIKELRKLMERIIESNLPFSKLKMRSTDAEDLFIENFQCQKAEVIKSMGRYTCSVYYLGDLGDSFHGPLVPSSSYLTVFNIEEYAYGFCLLPPSISDHSVPMKMLEQEKIANAMKKYSFWCENIGISGVGALNNQIRQGNAVKLINLSESLHERNYSKIADKIFEQRERKRIIMIAGPSSSGKTSSALRIALHCKVLGLNPKVIELDNYFVNRELTPRDKNGEYDFESIDAMDLQLLNEHLQQILVGEKVNLPKFDFKKGERYFDGETIQLKDNDILIMEGIHALNPKMIWTIDDAKIFKIYVSALSSLNIDENNIISTSDNRMLRRMIRDNSTRGIKPEENIGRWNSVRRGEHRNIFPFQENADEVFNSALIFELPLLKYYAEPLLRRISPNSPIYTEAVRLLKFLDFVIPLKPDEIKMIPPTSIMREFIGGQSLLV